MKSLTRNLFFTLVLVLPAFSVGLRAQTLTTLHSFTHGDDGSNPAAGLAQGSDGNFYGTTSTGGEGGSGDGTVFQITPAGVLTTLHDFPGVDANDHYDGNNPTIGLAPGRDGNFYGAIVDGGEYSVGSIYQITPAGVVTVLYSFQAGTDGAGPATEVVQGHDGNLYGTTQGSTLDGGHVPCTLYRLTLAGVLTTLHTFGPDITPAAALLAGSDGNFYGTTDGDGSNGAGTVFQLTPAGKLTFFYSFSAVDDNGRNTNGIYPGGPLIEGSGGNFYGVTHSGGTGGNGTVFQITPAGAITTLHSFAANGTEGEVPNATLVRGGDGNLYGTTLYDGGGAGTIFRLTSAGALTTLYSFPDTVMDGAVPQGGLIQGRDGNLYGTTYGVPPYSTIYGTVFRLNVVPAITSVTSTTGEVGEASSYQITATNNPTSFGAQGLPAGLSVNASTGLISGTPQTVGNYTLTLTAANGLGQGSATLMLNVVGAQSKPVITSATTATIVTGKAFSYQITSTGHPPAYGVQGLPGGLTVNASTGLVSGTPKFLGTFVMTLNAYNAYGKGSGTLTLTVQPAGAPVITSASSASGKLYQSFSYQIMATNSPTTYGVYGLPGGLTINAQTGLLSGVPQYSGTFTMTLNAYNSLGQGSESFVLTVPAN